MKTSPLTGRLSEYAHLIIDVQDKFCNPDSGQGTEGTKKTAKHIAKLAPIFNQLGIQTYWVYYDQFNLGPEDACGGFFLVQPNKEKDILIRKTGMSPFWNENLQKLELHEKLKQRGQTKILLSGFNLTGCLYETALDARSFENPYDVWINTDLAANDTSCSQKGSNRYQERIKEMEKEGVILTSSSFILSQLAVLHTQISP